MTVLIITAGKYRKNDITVQEIVKSRSENCE